MNKLAEVYLPVFLFLILVLGISLTLFLISFLRAPHHPDVNKLSQYECGFETLSDTRVKFNVQFYLVSILFIIFDLEIAFLFPWSITLSQTRSFGFWSMLTFLSVLTVGFIYEWKKGALEWE